MEHHMEQRLEHYLEPCVHGPRHGMRDAVGFVPSYMRICESDPGTPVPVWPRLSARKPASFQRGSFQAILRCWNSVFDTFSSRVESPNMIFWQFWNTPGRCFM